MPGDGTPASLLLRDAQVNLQVSDALAVHLPEAPFQHEVYFQAFYAIEKASKAVCDVCGIATSENGNWSRRIKTHDITELLRLLRGNPKLDNQMADQLASAAADIPFHPEQKYPDLVRQTIPYESEQLTVEDANEARTYAHRFVAEVETWVAARS